MCTGPEVPRDGCPHWGQSLTNDWQMWEYKYSRSPAHNRDLSEVWTTPSPWLPCGSKLPLPWSLLLVIPLFGLLPFPRYLLLYQFFLRSLPNETCSMNPPPRSNLYFPNLVLLSPSQEYLCIFNDPSSDQIHPPLLLHPTPPIRPPCPDHCQISSTDLHPCSHHPPQTGPHHVGGLLKPDGHRKVNILQTSHS